MSDHVFERTIQITKIVLLTAILVLAGVAFLDGPRSTNAQLASITGFSYVHINSATNTLAKGAAGTLHTVVVNGGGTAGVVTIVDTTAANCTGGSTIGLTTTVVAGQVYTYDLQFNNGLCITTAAATDITVNFR